MRKINLLVGLLAVSAGTYGQDISPELYHQPTQMDMGGVGLMQMPTARMNRAGEFTALYYDNEEYRRMALSIQLFPWLETTIRYNDVRTRLYSDVPEFSGDQTYKDRGVDVKLRLLEESKYLPEVSVGLRDFAGTGQFSGEFIAATKRWNDFDFTLGLGWGYIGRRGNVDNPFCEIADDYCDRPAGFQGRGGSFEYDEWFRGAMSVYGGVEYQTPWQPLSVKLEYDGNDYTDEPSRKPIIQDSPWNLGLHYRVSDNLNIQVSYERGNTLMFGFNLRTNFNSIEQVKRRKRKRTGNDLAQQKQPTTIDTIDTKQLVKALHDEGGWGTQHIQVSEDGKRLTTYGSQSKFRDKELGVERASRVLATETPQTIEEYEFISTSFNMPMSKASVDANKLREAMLAENMTADVDESIQHSDITETERQKSLNGEAIYDPPFELGMPSFGARPYLEQSFGGPENFYMYQLRLDMGMSWPLSENLILDAEAAASLLSNYDDFNYISPAGDAPLPRVRTFIREYSTQSDIWVQNIQATYVKQWSKELYSSFYGGYLERMFAGVGSEVMYRPYESNWGIGMNINWVKQRSFESHFGFHDYQTVTGHVTGYWEPEFLKDTRVHLAAGRFLAKDNGVKVQVEHKFNSGIIVGAFAAKTNVSAEEYGEGSFNKGFFISIPIDLMQISDSVGRANFGWAPLTRDGGQMLRRERTLLGVTDGRDRYYSN